jgi:hypothetical protein
MVTNKPRLMKLFKRPWGQGCIVHFMTAMPRWLPHPQKDNYFCLVTGERGGAETHLRLFEVHELQEQGSGYPLSSHRVTEVAHHRVTYPSNPAKFVGCSESKSPLFRFGEDFIFCAASGEKEMVTTVLSLPEQIGSDQSPKLDNLTNLDSATLTPPDRVWVRDGRRLSFDTRSGFCPMSGRLVYLATQEQIYISDFLLPLPDR